MTCPWGIHCTASRQDTVHVRDRITIVTIVTIPCCTTYCRDFHCHCHHDCFIMVYRCYRASRCALYIYIHVCVYWNHVGTLLLLSPYPLWILRIFIHCRDGNLVQSSLFQDVDEQLAQPIDNDKTEYGLSHDQAFRMISECLNLFLPSLNHVHN